MKGPFGDVSSVYQDTISLAGKSTLSVEDNSSTCKSRSTSPSKNLNPTATAINAGTPKLTMQIPGYRGHIPINLRNTQKLAHAYGEEPHPVKNDLMLTTKLSVLGYTGIRCS